MGNRQEALIDDLAAFLGERLKAMQKNRGGR
jgi:hypothetical protein